ncbi:hypothetical protein [Streptosporangium sp. NPDC002721]|uniref:hypothetical protein n=1 Tax=Streptosporangium sp. NPDC002721 TaxID=3366188 RepID=UPI0036B900FD
MNARDEYIAGLRALASLLETRPEVGLPYEGVERLPASVFISALDGPDPLAQTIAYVEAMEERPTVQFGYHPGRPNFWVEVKGRIRGLHLRVQARTSEVCELVDGEPVILPALLAAAESAGQSTHVVAGPDRVLAALAAALTTLPDVRHDTVILTAAVLAHQHKSIAPHEAAEMAANDCSGENTGVAWREAKRLLADALAAVTE